MMKGITSLLSGFFIVMLLCSAGCVTPPKPGTVSTPSGTASGITSGTTPVTPAPTITQHYVNEVTPFGPATLPSTGTTTSGYTVFTESTPIPQDQSCLIYLKHQTYSYNRTAFAFNLENPPMYINYSVIPTNVTIRRVVTLKTGSKGEETITYSDYSPYSWFEITVRNKTTGEIYLQDGFGPGKGYRIYREGTVKIMNRDDLQIEFYGNAITATAGVWVKPYGNFDDNMTRTFSECKYWESPRNSLAYATATATPTWTPVNEVKR
jgi:hypothetical protein